MNKQKYTYVDKTDIIDNEIRKRFYKWHLKALAWLDFEDVSQIIRFHIYKKWEQWDQSRPIEPWANKIISNQLKNILRNYYASFARPCLNCKHNQAYSDADHSLCGFTPSGFQYSECGYYAKWEKSKKNAYDIKIPVSLENVTYKKTSQFSDHVSMYAAEDKLHEAMRKNLNSRHFFIYKMLFIDCVDEELVAQILGYKTNEKGRKAGYKQIKNLKNMYKNMAKKFIIKYDIFL
mgnify:CR=1 FL=1